MQRKWLRGPVIVCAGVFMSSLDLFIVNIAFPSIAQGLRSHLAELAVVDRQCLRDRVRRAAGAAGRWADAFGRKRAFLLGLAGFVLASAACAIAPSVELLIAAR